MHIQFGLIMRGGCVKNRQCVTVKLLATVPTLLSENNGYEENTSRQLESRMIWYLFNRNWVDTRWQHHTTHLQQTIHTIHREYNSESAGRAPSLRVIPWHLPYNWGKSTEKTSVRVAQYKNNEQTQRTNTIQEHEPSQYKNNEQAPEPWNTIP